MKRRVLLPALLMAVTAVPLLAYANKKVVVEMYKTPYCGCCTEWVKHLEKNGLAVNVHEVDNTAPYRKKLGIPDNAASCHTATVAGYAIEGHVPAKEIRRLLSERPNATALAVPGMPMGSPGMEGPRSDAYDVLLVKKDGNTSVYQHYDAK